ncbi:hypothetical protein JTE90_024447 [Oedothorax gibbosus]|uniref:Uncharacterized protein n=1 Tax=Oedothorax gibbosus TaxID=931172 RepID=A0AAV6UBZ6_9ARAC|nr:hypothetical protein JTE90_024447 [Oedothorax gibbosus]
METIVTDKLLQCVNIKEHNKEADIHLPLTGSRIHASRIAGNLQVTLKLPTEAFEIEHRQRSFSRLDCRWND